MFLTITTSKATPGQFQDVETFLHEFLPRLKQQPGVLAIYHYTKPEQGDESTIILWENEEAVKAYRTSDIKSVYIVCIWDLARNLATARVATTFPTGINRI